MNHNNLIAVAMSGGVDSSVAAALMVEKYGKEHVFGITMKLFCYNEKDAGSKSCCSIDAINDARSVCENLGIPHYVVSLEKEFEETVIKNFISEYRLGHTPIPCVICNTEIKFKSLLKKVRELGADTLVTGHYARVNKESKTDIYQLLRGKDETKDQSYFLYGLTANELPSINFPLGGMKKTEVRKLAQKYGLKTAEKKESQGICFVTEGRVTDYLSDEVESKPGNIVDTKGNIIGRHDGIIFYTVGQRKRIGGGHKDPMYVVSVNKEKNEVVIGTKEELYRDTLEFTELSWLEKIAFPKSCTAKIRYNMEAQKCVITKNTKQKKQPNLYIVKFETPQRAITPGQSIVFYEGDKVLGGGIIC